MEKFMPSQQVSERIANLRETMFAAKDVTIERNLLIMESYSRTAGQPACIRRAKALENILRNMTLYIGEDELLVGRLTDKPRACCYPCATLVGLVRNDDTLAPLPEGRIQIPEEYNKTIIDMAKRFTESPKDGEGHISLPRRYFEFWDSAFSCGPGGGHHSVDYELILKRGALGLIEDIDRELEHDKNASEDKINQLTASKVALGALMTIAERYADYAAELAAEEKDEARRAELEAISHVCRRVPTHPAENFHEAVQAVWFTNLAMLHENWAVGIGFMRPDQYLYPYYVADIERGTLNREKAFMLLSMLLIKTNEELTAEAAMVMSINMTLGGVDEDGNCAVNELSWLFLDAEEAVALSDEDIIIRVNENMPPEFLERACEVARKLNGKMKFVGDEIIIRQLMHDGRPLELARNYCITGCNSATVPGWSYDMPGTPINLPFMLDIALHDGFSTTLGKQAGVHSGDARQFESYEQVWDAFVAQLQDWLPFIRSVDNHIRAERAKDTLNPLQSVLNHGYIQKGIDVRNGGNAPYISLGISLAGAPNVGDALAAIKKLVFEEKRLSMAELIDALDRNFEGDDALLSLISRVPKFGNDNEYVDSIVNDVLVTGADILEREPCIWGAYPVCAGGVISTHIALGKNVGALPDGRLAGQPISEGGISPYQGRNTTGATATLMSVAKLDHLKLRHGSVLNMRVAPKTLDGEENVRRFAQMLMTYFKTGGFLVQFNITTTETLLAAQEEPEKYRDLIVRVATYASFFVDLEKDLQDDIICRSVLE